MSQKTQTESILGDIPTQTVEGLKALTAWQWKTSQTMIDQALKFGQTWMDMTTETYKASVSAGESLRKDVNASAVKYF